MELEAEFGCSQPMRFGGLHVTLCDSEGNEMQMPNCKCGKPSTTIIRGNETILYQCYECMTGEKEYTAKFIYRTPNGENK